MALLLPPDTPVQTLFHPFRLLLSRLDRPWVVLVLGLSMATLLAGLANSVFQRLHSQWRITVQEQEGLDRVARIRAVLQPLQAHRGLDQAVFRGDAALEVRRRVSAAQVDRALRFLPAPTDGPPWEPAWLALRVSNPGEDRFARHDRLIDRLQGEARRVIDDSGLILDADAGTYHLIAILDGLLGHSLEQAARLRGFQVAQMAGAGGDGAMPTHPALCAYALEVGHKLVDHHVAALLRQRPDLREALGDLPGRLEQSTAALLRLLLAHAVVPTAKPETAVFFQQASATIDHGYALFDRTLVLTRQSLGDRQVQQERQMLWTGAGMLALTLVMAYLFVGIVASVRVSRRATGALARREALFKRMLEHLPVGVGITDAEGRVVSINPAGEKIRAAISPTDARLSDPESPLTQALLRNEAVLDCTLDIDGCDGERKHVRCSAVPLHDEQGRVNGGLLMTEDITDSVAVQRSQQEERNFIDAVLETVGAIVLVLDGSGRVVRFNRACERVSGYGAEEVIGNPYWEKLIPPEQAAGISQAFSRLTPDQFPHQQENHWRTREGRLRLIAWSNTCIPDDQGQVRYVIATGIDITEAQAAAAELQLAARVFSHAGEAIMVTDAANRIVKVNPAFTAITGFTPEEVLGDTPGRFKSGCHDQAFYQDLWRSLKETGAWEGEILDRRRDGSVYPKWLSISTICDGQGEVRNYVALFRDISAHKRHEERIRHLAEHDALTGLPNRALLQDRLTQAMARAERAQSRLALLYIDLDRFKLVNDTLGHPVGDALLQEVARRLQATVRVSDTVSRQGGDEFLVLLDEIESGEDAARVAGKMLELLARPCHLASYELRITPSIGISLYPDDGTDMVTLIRNADVAMYQAKESGRDNYRFYTVGMNSRTCERLALEQGLRRAVDSGEVTLYFQPRKNLDSGRITALVTTPHWQHPVRGLLPLDGLHPISDAGGLSGDLGELILRAACHQSQAWLQAGRLPVPVVVPLAAGLFRRAGLASSLREILATTGLPPRLLQLQLAEVTAMEQPEASIECLHELGELGVSLSLVDFGQGVSSLAWLDRLPLQVLQLSPSFTRDVARDARSADLVSGIIALAHRLGLRVIADGVETAEQAAILQGLGCAEAQGSYYSPPLLPAEMAAVLGGE